MEERISELEIKVAYQDDTIQQLNDVVVRQQKDLERLKTLMSDLNERFTGMSSALESKSEHEIPPHY